MLAKHSQHVILIGFSLLLSLMLGLTLLGLSRMKAMNQHFESIVRVHAVKTEYLNTLASITRERFIALYNLTVTQDPFDKDEEFVQFHQRAADFITMRAKLQAMPQSPEETAALEKLTALTRVSAPLQRRVVDSIEAGDLAEASHRLLKDAMPVRNQVLAQLDTMLAMQKKASEQAVQAARQAYAYAYMNMIALGVTALGFGLFITFFVVRRVRAAEDALFREKELAEVTLHSIGDAVITVDSTNRVTYLNPVAEYLTAWSWIDARGQPLMAVFRLFDAHSRQPIQMAALQSSVDGLTVGLSRHTVLLDREDKESIVEFSTAPLRNRAGKVMGTVLVFRDVTAANALEQQLFWQASHDSLTGLDNRSAFEQKLLACLNQSRKQEDHHVLIYFDLDQFKLVNDTCGHAAGDALLRQLTVMLQSQLMPQDTLARLGGDEFAVLLENCPLSRGCVVAEELRKAVSEFRFVWGDKAFSLGISIGIVPVSAASESVAALLSAADTACYAAKEEGRNRIHVFEANDHEWMKRYGEMLWVSRINKAMEEDRLQLFYQLISPTSPSEGRTRHVEILLRMVDEKGHLVTPGTFIPAAERYNLMPALDRWVIQHTFDWLVEYLLRPPRKLIPCAINLSGQSLCDTQFLDFVMAALQRSGIPPHAICFEITETAAIANLAQAKNFITQLKAMGCRFALDDFGSGMSSFAYLKNLPVDYLKIDGAFVRDMAEDPVDYAMVEAINRIGHVMGLQTIAEFVENHILFEHLKFLGVDYVQGYGIHKPEPITHLANLQLRA